MKENSSHKEDNLFREKLEELDFEYNYQDWKEIESRIDSTSKIARIKKLSIAAAIVVSTSILVWDFNSKVAELKENTVELNIDNSKSYESEYTEKDLDIEEDDQDLKIESKEIKPSYSYDNESKQQVEITAVDTIKEDQVIAEVKPSLDNSNNIEKENIVPISKEDNFTLDSIQLIGKPCIGESISFIAHNADDSYNGNYEWSINGQKISNQDRKISYQIINEENILVEVSMNNNQTLSRELKIYNLIKPDFTYLDNERPYDDFKVEFTSNSGNLTHIWRVEEQVIEPHQSKIEFVFKDEGIYDVELILVNDNKCSASIKKPISVVQNFDVLAPNAFTPDGDGLNDDFIPHGFLSRDDLFKMEIFDISGKLVYSTKSISEPWNGNFNNSGEKLLEGMYIWKVSISNTKNQSNAYAGSVRLIRKN